MTENILGGGTGYTYLFFPPNCGFGGATFLTTYVSIHCNTLVTISGALMRIKYIENSDFAHQN